jgi:TatD DNase family protein
MLIDTHCHIHEADYSLDITDTIQHAHEAGVDTIICVGTGLESSVQAVSFAMEHSEAYASLGVHPHDTKDGWQDLAHIEQSEKIVAIGEIGLDYFYTNSPREVQIEALKWQIELALSRNLPIIFHVRDAFDDFWPIFDSYSGIRGVLHSFTDSKENLEKAFERGLFIGVNGISTFTKDPAQQAMFASIPLERLLLETDAPFLTPAPFRGKVNEPAFVKNVAQHHASVRGISLEDVALATTANAHALFAF